MYFSVLLWASTSAAIQPGLSSSNVVCFIAIVAIVSFEQINHCHCHVGLVRFWHFSVAGFRLFGYSGLTSMSVLLIVGPKCMLAASHAAPWRVTVSGEPSLAITLVLSTLMSRLYLWLTRGLGDSPAPVVLPPEWPTECCHQRIEDSWLCALQLFQVYRVNNSDE